MFPSLPAVRLVALWMSVVSLAAVTARAAETPAPASLQKTKPRVLPVALALTPNAQAAAAQVAYILESAVKRSARHEFVDPVQKFDPAGAETRRGKAEKAADAMAEGKKGYEGLEEGLGNEHFERAIQSYEESALWDNFRGLTQANAWRIVVKWAEDQLLTRKDVQHLIYLDPKAEFPADFTSPDLLQEIKRAKDQRAAEPKFSLDVNTDPVAARVYVDGAYRGTAPTSVRGLTPGEHYLSLVAPGYQVDQRKVRAGPGATATVTLKPADNAKKFLTFMERIAQNFGEEDEVTGAGVLGRVAQVDELLIAGVRREGGRLVVGFHRIQMSDRHVSGLTTLDVGENDSQLAMLVNQAAERNLANDRPHGEKGEPLGIKSDFEHALGKITNVSEDTVTMGIGIGGGALFLGGVIAGLLARGDETEVRQMAQVDPNTADALSGGFATAVTADVLMSAGVIAGCVWGWREFGRAFSKKSNLDTPPVLEDQREKEPEKKKPKEIDPFDADNMPPADDARPTLHATATGFAGTF